MRPMREGFGGSASPPAAYLGFSVLTGSDLLTETPRSTDPPLGDRVIRSHRRDEPGRRLAFRILTAVMLPGSGLSVALITAGGGDDPHQTPVRTSDELSRALPRIPADPTLEPSPATDDPSSTPTTPVPIPGS